MYNRFLTNLALACAALAVPAMAKDNGQSTCNGLPNENQLKGFLSSAPGAGGDAGGLFHGQRMWAAVVNRDGKICATHTGLTDTAAFEREIESLL